MTIHNNYFIWDEQPRPLRAALLEWLGMIADSAAHGETTREEHCNDPRDTDAVRAVRGLIYDAVLPHLRDSDPTVRDAALGATIALLQSPGLADRIPEATQGLWRLISKSSDRRERAGAVLTIGAWGQDTTRWLADPDPAIRACAALSPACADNPEATRTILQALLDPATVDSWFLEPTKADPWAGRRLPHIEGRLQHTLVATAIDRTNTFEELLPAALASVPLCSNLTIADDWGPLLAAAFPSGHDQHTPLTPAQHRYLNALVDHDLCWRYTHLITTWFDGIGLPSTRNAIKALLTDHHRTNRPTPEPNLSPTTASQKYHRSE
ncbi:HEAT repeat domain-containing protein [Streptomyces wedmorensis]|uniref:HEAT repeat domain-containing protein n=1 Tax=Streptomyces wedmorensis TaxID=43759 RepID=A0ABW6J3L6_STRWE